MGSEGVGAAVAVRIVEVLRLDRGARIIGAHPPETPGEIVLVVGLDRTDAFDRLRLLRDAAELVALVGDLEEILLGPGVGGGLGAQLAEEAVVAIVAHVAERRSVEKTVAGIAAHRESAGAGQQALVVVVGLPSEHRLATLLSPTLD